MTTLLRRIRGGLRWLLVGVTAVTMVALGGLAVGLGAGWFGDSAERVEFSPIGYAEPVAAPEDRSADRDRAVAAAQRAVPGATVQSAAPDVENGRRVWEVDLRDGRGEVDVTVDADSVAVLSVERDD